MVEPRAVFRWILLFGLALTCGRLEAAEALAPPEFSPAERAAIGLAFAPILVFHPLEHYFPTSSMLSLSAEDGTEPSRPGLEVWSLRVDSYRALSLAAKLQRAALGYRVFTRADRDGPMQVVVEYWCYYVYNEFTVRGTWLPYRVRDNHPHDLERLYLILSPTGAAHDTGGVRDEAWARAAFRIQSVVANAHDGSIPPNRYDVSDGHALTPPLTMLVERGSHAMAPDIDRDGRFTPGIDSTAAPKLQWGIRDTGATGSRYRDSFMDDRDASAARLCGPTEEFQAEMAGCLRYALYPADHLQSWFQGFELSPRDRHDVLGRSPWLVRTFGDVRLENLMVPPDPPDGSVLDAMVRRRIRGTRGFVTGLTAAGRSPAIIVGKRYFWNMGPRRAPDIAAEGVALFSVGRRPQAEGTLWGSYTFDAITNLVFGAGWFSARGVADIAAGSDLRVGRFTVRPTWRVRERMFNARITTTF